MVTDTVMITIDPESEIGRALEQTRGRRLIVCLEVNGVRYRVGLDMEHNPFAHSDPEQMRAALRASAGALKGVDVEALKRELREQR